MLEVGPELAEVLKMTIVGICLVAIFYFGFR